MLPLECGVPFEAFVRVVNCGLQDFNAETQRFAEDRRTGILPVSDFWGRLKMETGGTPVSRVGGGAKLRPLAFPAGAL
jgi:hypothetical protein